MLSAGLQLPFDGAGDLVAREVVQPVISRAHAVSKIGTPQVIAVNGVLLVVVAIYFLVIRSHGVREA